MKLNRLFLVGFLFTTDLLCAQTDFRPGYIITSSGDTLYGTIDYRGDLLMSKICTFKSDNKTIEYSPNDITAYRFTNSKYYVAKEIDQSMVFLECLFGGKVSIYYMRDASQDHYYIEKDDPGIKEIPYVEDIRYVDDKKVHYRSTLHIGLLSYFMQDASQLQSRIQSIKKPEHQKLIRLAREYQRIAGNGEEYTIFENNRPILKVNLELLSGVMKFESVEGVTSKFYPQNGLIANFWMPRTNEKIYFRTGLLYSQFELEGEQESFRRVPMHIGYLAPGTHKIRPSVSISLISPAYSGGVVAKIGKRLNIGVQSWVEYLPAPKMFLIPRQLYSYSLLANLYIEL